jgi:hypothetical protein
MLVDARAQGLKDWPLRFLLAGFAPTAVRLFVPETIAMLGMQRSVNNGSTPDVMMAPLPGALLINCALFKIDSWWTTPAETSKASPLEMSNVPCTFIGLSIQWSRVAERQ